VTRDEIRGLIGAYATGSLTEEERGILFNAALEDQEIFDELAREQALKQAIEQPGGRERLLRALEPRPWWRPIWVWATAGAAAIALISGIILIRSGPPSQQIAKVELPQSAPIPTPLPPPSEPAPVPKVVPKTSVPSETPSAERRFSPAVQAPPPKQESSATVGTVAGTENAPGLPAGVGGVAPRPLADRDGAGGGGGGGVRANRALVAPLAAQAPAPPRFSFDYSVSPEGLLRITAAANGFLSVSSDNGTVVSDVLSSRQVQTGSVTEVRLPTDTVTAIILFSARGRSYLAGDFAVSQDPLSGTKSDPNPSPDSVLVAHVRLRP